MPSLIGIGSSGLLSYRTAIETVSNNIANVNTEGYSRQRTIFETKGADKVQGGYINSGVTVGSIERLANDAATRRMQESYSDFNLNDSFYDRAVVIDSYFNQEESNMGDSINQFFDALEQMNQAPDTLPPRNVFLGQMSIFADQMRDFQNIIDSTQSNLDQQLNDTTAQMTDIAATIADINNQVATGEYSPDLLDQRDVLVHELASYVDVNTYEQSDGSLNITIGRGESLVIGNYAATVTSGQSPDDGSTQIFLSVSGNTFEITPNIVGGSVEGMMNFEEQVLRESSRKFGLIAMGIAENFNQQNQMGLDYNGDLGENIFTDYNSTLLQLSRSTANTNNTSVPAAEVQVRIADTSQLQNSEYNLTMTGLLTGTLVRESDNTSYAVTFAAPGAPPPALEIATVDGAAATSIDGFEIDFTNAPATGDVFTISPTRDMARHLESIVDDGKLIALASPVRAYADSSNQGSGSIEVSSVTTVDTTAGNVPDLTDQFQINILDLDPAASPTNDFQYEIVNVTDGTTLGAPPGPPLLYGNLGEAITVYDDLTDTGYDVIISGDIKVGDAFISEYNSNGVGDNTNGNLMLALQEAQLLLDSSHSFYDVYADTIADIGTETYQAGIRRDSAELLYELAEFQRLEAVGVNLDEEAANLVALQQAYQASGQVIATARDMMDIIFSLIGG